MKNSKGKKSISFLLYLLLVVIVVGAGAAIAYFTSSPDAKANTITFGNVSIQLLEPNFSATLVSAEPNDEIAKDPIVKNTGNNAYVYLKVSVPKKSIRTVNDDQTVNAASVTELFSYDINSGWTLIDSDTTNSNNNVYVYAYTAGALANNASTDSLFDTIKYANVYEGDVTDATVDVVVDALAIQADQVNFTGDDLTEQLTNAYNSYLKG